MGLEIPVVLVPVLVFLGIASVFLTIETATSGAYLAQLEQEEAGLIKEKRMLNGQIVKASSLLSTGKKAQYLGFKKPSRIIYITEKEAVAKLP